MNQDRTNTVSPVLRTPGHALTLGADEQLRRTVADRTVRPRRLIAAGVKYGNSRLIVQAVNA